MTDAPRLLLSLPFRGALVAALGLAACGSVTNPTGPDGGDTADAPITEDDGHITYTLDGDLYRVGAFAGATPENISALIGGGASGDDRRLNLSPGGSWYVFETTRLAGCTGGPCLAIAPVGDPGAAALVIVDGAPITSAESLSAVSDDGDLVVFAASSGPHDRDLYSTRRESGGWTSPRLLTEHSSFAWNDQPALHSDGWRILFDCSPVANAAGDGASICETGADGGTLFTFANANNAPPGISHAGPLHHADFAPGGIVFEADWDGERIWSLETDGTITPLTDPSTSNDNSPCVLPDGRVASLWLGDPGNPDGRHELKLMNPDGTGAALVLRGRDILDVGLGCGE